MSMPAVDGAMTRRGTIMNELKFSCVVVACILVLTFPLAQAQSLTESPAAKATAQRVTLNVIHLTRLPFWVSAFVETRSTADACVATYNASSRVELLQPVFCDVTEFRGKRGIRLTSNLWAYPPDNFAVTITVFQQGAQYYGVPVVVTSCNKRNLS